MPNKQNNINAFPKTNNIILKYDISLNIAFFQPLLKLGNLVFPSVGLLFINIKGLFYKAAHNISRTVRYKSRD